MNLLIKTAEMSTKQEIIANFQGDAQTFKSFYNVNKSLRDKWAADLSAHISYQQLSTEPTWKEFFDAILVYIKTLLREFDKEKASEAFENSDRGQKVQWQEFLKSYQLVENIKECSKS